MYENASLLPETSDINKSFHREGHSIDQSISLEHDENAKNFPWDFQTDAGTLIS